MSTWSSSPRAAERLKTPTASALSFPGLKAEACRALGQSDLCAAGLSAQTLECLEAASCPQLMAYFSDPSPATDPCGFEAPPTDPPPTGADCTGYPRCDESGRAVSCTMSGSVRELSTRVCASGEQCRAGMCEALACVETGRTGCMALNNPSLCCDDRATCFGNGNARGETICCVPQNSACSETSDCCNNDATNFTVTCDNGVCKLGV